MASIIILMASIINIGVQVCRMGCVPAYNGNGNSRNVVMCRVRNPACTAIRKGRSSDVASMAL